MVPNVEYIKSRFDEFNRKMFAGHLPAIPVRMTDAKSFLGQCVSRIRILPDGRKEHYDFYLKFSIYYDQPQNVIDDTIIHEMIHYFILYNGLPDSSPHGQIFRSIMSNFNREYGLNLRVSHRNSPQGNIQPANNGKRTWHIIALVVYHSGQTGFKVLPRVASKAIKYHDTVLQSPEIKSVQLYIHDNPFFNQFPTSAALKVHLHDNAELLRNMKGARKLKITSRGLTPSTESL